MKKISYLLIWLATIYLGILYYSPALMGLGMLELLLPLGSALLLFITVRKSRISVSLPIGVAEKGQPVTVGIEIENKSGIPISRLQAKLKIKNRFYKESKTAVVRGMAEGRGKTRLTTVIDSSQCGMLLLELEEVKASDLFGMFEKKIKVKGLETLAIMPQIYTANVLIDENTSAFLIESEEYDKKKSGDDHAEIFQIREYRGGDRIQSIHWKLSARTNDLMVKEYSLPIGSAVVFFLDMEYDPDAGYGYLDEFIESGLAISHGLLEAGCEHYIVWFDRVKQDLVRVSVKESDDLYLVIESFLQAGPYADPVMMDELYREKYRGESWQTQLLLNLRKELWRDDTLLMGLSGNARETLENGELII
ncbi:MAG: DUF58 domain-containing protein [Clostridia bacterium]|nr:DUF58 domain-containing protein [Clostridia bacterium]NCC42211.1 DUF58 domain-containing protein [Clostridia bacterium]